ncbi:hypothetical protein [Spirillospora sp. CA-294931]|uniref:hypothetical protein n=1 Tax=Spirillospora sp. CA-294931 TaxID=3240042 RepID=UPI003D8E5E20
MPSQPQSGRRQRAVNFSDDDWEPGRAAAEQVGDNRNNVIERLYAWWLRRPGAELPERPPQEVIDQADAAWEALKTEIAAEALKLPCTVCDVAAGPCLMGKGKGKRPSKGFHRPRFTAATAIVKERYGDTSDD